MCVGHFMGDGPDLIKKEVWKFLPSAFEEGFMLRVPEKVASARRGSLILCHPWHASVLRKRRHLCVVFAADVVSPEVQKSSALS